MRRKEEGRHGGWRCGKNCTRSAWFRLDQNVDGDGTVVTIATVGEMGVRVELSAWNILSLLTISRARRSDWISPLYISNPLSFPLRR